MKAQYQAAYAKTVAGKLVIKRNYNKRKEWYWSLKDRPCSDCGNEYPSCCMEFDHVRGIKISNVSVLFTRAASKKRILDEVAKCELVCANCHAIRTHNRTVGKTTLADNRPVQSGRNGSSEGL